MTRGSTSCRAVPVYWGTYSLVEAELACLADLLAVPSWKFALNLWECLPIVCVLMQ